MQPRPPARGETLLDLVDFSLINDPIYNHHQFLKLIIRSALKRQNTMLSSRMRRRQVKRQRVEEMAYT